MMFSENDKSTSRLRAIRSERRPWSESGLIFSVPESSEIDGLITLEGIIKEPADTYGPVGQSLTGDASDGQIHGQSAIPLNCP